MIKYGSNNIGKIYFGSNQIGKAYLGSNLVYDSGSGPTPPGPVLPYDAEVEYLQGDGNTYIYTGINASGNMQIKARLVDFFGALTDGAKWPFGGRNAWHDRCFGLYINTNDNKVYFDYNSTSYPYNTYSSYPSTCDVEIGSGVVKIGTTTHSYSVASFTSNYNLMLFALNNGGTAGVGKMKIGRVYITNGTQTLDLIPCRKNGVGYMYDTVSGTFMTNSGSGAFIIGPDVQ